MLVGASRITVSFRPAIPPRVAPQQSPLPLRRFAYYSVSAHFGTRNATRRDTRGEEKESQVAKIVLDFESPIQGLG